MALNGVIPIRKAYFIDRSRASMYSEISNPKHQIPNKSQISISKDPNRFVILNFGHCDLFIICDLEFEIFQQNSKVSLTIKMGAPPASGRAEPGTDPLRLMRLTYKSPTP
jgi:hypothetical protein